MIFAQHAHHRERLAIDGDRAVERIDAAGKELVDNAGPEHDDLSLKFVVELGDGAAHRDVEAVHDKRRRQDAPDILSGGAALVGKSAAARDRDFGGDALGEGDGVENRIHVVHGSPRRELRDFPLSVRGQPRQHADAFDPAGLVDHRFPAAEESLDDAEHTHESGRPEDDAEKGQEGAELVREHLVPAAGNPHG